ncbi:MAG TPA: isochorismatase family protein [Streptosporangiaceae bacterium]
MPLIARDDSVLIVVDLQPAFWGERLDASEAASAVAAAKRAAWLAATATALGIPAVITEEDRQHNGPTDAAVLAALAPGTPVFAKPVFGLADCEDIMQAVRGTGRRTAVLAGFETDVCVTHSAVGLAESGYRVVVASDAVYSPSGGHAAGLARLRDLRFELLTCKSVYYDWVRTLAAARAFQREHPCLAQPPGFAL